jgi:hypothetical protein
MALLRVIAIAIAIAGCACRRTEAAPSPIAAPAGWKSAPELAKAATDAAKSDTVKVVAADAWSEPAMGCYGIALRLVGGAAAIDTAADQLVASIQKAGVTVSNVAKPAVAKDDPRGVLALEFANAKYHGVMRAELAKTGEVFAVSCMWNQREPKACAAACSKLVEGVPGLAKPSISPPAKASEK